MIIVIAELDGGLGSCFGWRADGRVGRQAGGDGVCYPRASRRRRSPLAARRQARRPPTSHTAKPVCRASSRCHDFAARPSRSLRKVCNLVIHKFASALFAAHQAAILALEVCFWFLPNAGGECKAKLVGAAAFSIEARARACAGVSRSFAANRQRSCSLAPPRRRRRQRQRQSISKRMAPRALISAHRCDAAECGSAGQIGAHNRELFCRGGERPSTQ